MTDRVNHLARLRAAIQRHGGAVNSRSSMAKCCREVEKILGRKLSIAPAEQALELSRFMERGISHGLPVRPFVPLRGYEAMLYARKALAEGTR